jgi:hypothetical protein
LEVQDSRAIHLREVVKVKNDDLVDLAVRNGPKGKGRVLICADGAIELDIQWAPEHSNDLLSLLCSNSGSKILPPSLIK